MTSKHWTLVGGAVACLMALSISSSAIASSWVEPGGDTYARFKLQQAADRGELDAVVSSLPLSRGNAQLSRNPDGSTNIALLLTPECGSELRRT